MAWLKKKSPCGQVSEGRIPKHIAFIADGNGRWANERGLPRFEGHRVGKDAIKKVIDRCFDRGVSVVSLYLFSTENFNRPKDEVEYIFNLFRQMSGELVKSLLKRDAQFRLMGDLSLLPADIQVSINDIIQKTSTCASRVVNFGLAYGSRHEIVGAVNKLLASGIKVITEENFKNYLDTAGLPDPDLIVRASGEQRLSNFMLYQAAYSEFYFPKKYWPDFDEKVVDECIEAYQNRKRRFGNI